MHGYLVTLTGKDYENIGTRQQCRRQQKIKEQFLGFASPLCATGLQLISIQPQTTNNNTVNLQLMPAQCSDMDKDSPCVHNIAYLMLRYGVSMEFYHELSMIADGLPKSYKV